MSHQGRFTPNTINLLNNQESWLTAMTREGYIAPSPPVTDQKLLAEYLFTYGPDKNVTQVIVHPKDDEKRFVCEITLRDIPRTYRFWVDEHAVQELVETGFLESTSRKTTRYALSKLGHETVQHRLKESALA